jgi:hypothetical protein
MRFAHGVNLVRGWRRAFTGLHFRRFATFPQRPTRRPAKYDQLQGAPGGANGLYRAVAR